jgi:outer membrane protein assembly factor BamB
MATRSRAGGALLTLIILASCGGPNQAESSGVPRADVLFLRSAASVAVVRTGEVEPAFKAPAVPSSDWSTVVRGILGSETTRVAALNPYSGEERWDQVVRGKLNVKIVSNDGERVALAPVRERHFSLGRAKTELVVTGRKMGSPRVVELAGNYEPEAFSTDGKSLFVIKYLPARNPSRYQVRRLDVATGRVHGVYTPDAHLQRAMGGNARVQAGSPDGRRLYTLYTVREAGERYAFIHVLSLDELWAHCIDLPAGFGTNADSATVITLSPDGRRLYVGNAATGALAEIDSNTFGVLNSTTVDFGEGRGSMHAAHDSGGNLYFGRGRNVTAVDARSLTSGGAWQVPRRITGLQVAADDRRVYVGMPKQVAVVEPTAGRLLETIDPPGIRWIDQFGPVMRGAGALSDFVCAC